MDATISVICFKSKTLANGEHPLMLRITKDRKRTMKSLGVSVHPSNWDFDRNEPKPKCPDRKYIQQIILKVKTEYQNQAVGEKAPTMRIIPLKRLSRSSPESKSSRKRSNISIREPLSNSNGRGR